MYLLDNTNLELVSSYPTTLTHGTPVTVQVFTGVQDMTLPDDVMDQIDDIVKPKLWNLALTIFGTPAENHDTLAPVIRALRNVFSDIDDALSIQIKVKQR